MQSLKWPLIGGSVLLLAFHPTGMPDAREEVLALFDEAQLVFLGERHLSKQDSEFRIGLIRHPHFADHVDDVVIEFGNSLYQDLLDAYFLDLEDMSDAELNQVWRNTTTTSGVWDSPIYERFLRELRTVNEGLAQRQRIRVIAGGPPIDWEKVEVFEDMLPYTYRGWSGVRQIERLVLAVDRKALVIYGYGHFLRLDDEMDEDDNMVRRLESLYPHKRFSVVVPFASVGGGTADLTGVIDADSLPVYVDAGSEPFRGWNASEYLWGAVGTLSEVVDGLVYFGTEDDERPRPTDEFYRQHPEYQQELERRRGLKPRIARRQSYN
ncbi:MAG: hypothetical protein ACYSVY_25390 [Planctomycetota bacterium]|jgi:hypothetical protein